MSELEKRILDTIWKKIDPITALEISRKTGLKNNLAIMYLQSLKKAGLVTTAQDGYTITEDGRHLIGFPKVSEKKAQEILRKTSPGNAFYFYTEVNRPSGVSSDCFADFLEKIESVDVKSIEFHTSRGDFESWIRLLGDVELEKKLGLIREANLVGEELRQRLYTALKTRRDELLQKVAHT